MHGGNIGLVIAFGLGALMMFLIRGRGSAPTSEAVRDVSETATDVATRQRAVIAEISKWVPTGWLKLPHFHEQKATVVTYSGANDALIGIVAYARGATAVFVPVAAGAAERESARVTDWLQKRCPDSSGVDVFEIRLSIETTMKHSFAFIDAFLYDEVEVIDL